MPTPQADVFVGYSPVIRAIREEIRYAASSDAKILLTGESGVGKEVVARMVHAESARRNAPFVPMNCAGVPETLLESELFGHERGSFTGAYRCRIGLLEQAKGGTFFMDEVGEMSPRMQTLLLRFLETGEIQRVGGEGRLPCIDTRVIAATNRNLLERISLNEFREDLYYRLNVMHIQIPPLRERRDDVMALMRHFLGVYAAHYQVPLPDISVEAEALLMEHEWPGNVRELKNVAERLIVRCPGPALTAAHLTSVLVVTRAEPVAPPPAAAAPLSTPDVLFHRIVKGGESFWRAVYDPYMARDITRGDLRVVIGRGMELSQGNCKLLVRLFNMEAQDYKRFLNFLNKNGCNLRFQQARHTHQSVDARTVA